MSREPFFDKLADEFSELLRHRHYHQHQSTANATLAMPVITATEAPRMSLIATLEADAEAVRSHVEEFMKSKLPAATADLKKLEALAGNPVVLSLLSAVHVPTEALTMAVTVIDKLEELYKPETAVAAPSEPVAPVAAPAEPVAAPVA